jgi:7-carboxy-7-deazaguanine synthase
VKYPVANLFSSIQGEGHFVGYPMVFIRLAGCSVTGCHIRKECDEAPWKMRSWSTADELADWAARMGPGGIACITGGEPTDHDLVPLVDRLRGKGLRVHMETSGVRAIEGAPIDWLTVSPKTADYQQRTGSVLKVVVRPEWSLRNVLALDEGTTFFHRYLQPLTAADGSNNLSQVIAMVRALPGARWALSTQAHRVWNVI